MSFKIVVDSCGEFPERLRKDDRFVHVPLQLQVEDDIIIDDDSFHQADFLKKVKESPKCPKSSCPSPEVFMNAYNTSADHVYAVTLSSKLSGSYNSAVLGKNLYGEEAGEKDIHVFDSKSASIGQTLIALKIEEYENKNLPFSKIVEKVEEYIEEMHTYFVLETLETLRKNGRLSNLKAFVAGALNIKPIMGSNQDGTIGQLGQARGMNRALSKMVEVIGESLRQSESKVLAISHCNCPERAEWVKQKLTDLFTFQDVFICDTAGVSSLYANDGGIIVVV